MRRSTMANSAVLLVCLGLIVAGVHLAGQGEQAADRHRMTAADVERWMTELSNWGRWGEEDELGAVNLITPAKRREAAQLVREGVSVSLARNAEMTGAVDNPYPFSQEMKMTPPFASDVFSVRYHGFAHTHIDALCHLMHGGKLYNRFPETEVTEVGANKLGILELKNGIFTRGILMDIPRLRKVPYLDPATAIYPDDLEAWEKQAGVRVASGDAVFIRTGRWARRDEMGPWDVGKSSAGLHASCVKWLRQRDVALVGSDAASDVLPSQIEGADQPVHQLLLVAMGVPIFDNCDLEALGSEAEKQSRWEFLLTAAPLPVPGGTGSPLNPIATF